MKHFLSLSLVLLATCLLPKTTCADSVSVNFLGVAGTGSEVGAAGVGLPYGVESSGVWTNFSMGGTTATDLSDDSGTATTLDITGFNPAGVEFFGAAYQGTPMNRGAAFYGPTGSNVRFQLDDIPYQSYDVIVYLTGFAGNTGSEIFLDDGTGASAQSFFWQTPNPANATLVQTTNTTGTAIPVANFATFSGLSGNSQLFRAQLISGGGGAIGGVQIVDTTAVPEPTSLCALGIIGLGLVARRRRNL